MSTVETISKKSCASKQGSRANWGIHGTILAFAYVPGVHTYREGFCIPARHGNVSDTGSGDFCMYRKDGNKYDNVL
jgi:hypothetical protein